MRIGAIIFSRLSSKRLPNKALEFLGDKSLINHVVDRAKKIKNISNLIVATSNARSDDMLVNHIKNFNVHHFRGELDDVTLRAYNCCDKFNLDAFVRICGDRPFFDPEEVSKAIEFFLLKNSSSDIDMVTNINRNVAPGLKIEILKKNTLKFILQSTDSLDYREHITKYIYHNLSDFNIVNLKKPNYNDEKNSYVIDNYFDLDRTKYVLKKMNFKNIFNMKKIIETTDQWMNNKKNNE